ncbi:APC family permease [Acetobacteraceae bacterium KSS8]|uniref:APC family permease n=1 Tax=Endosaccharibacter trunci TaxID=2812733 RepID=A0ABT1W5D5_9PROT|nr:APC family permease [Acetobacteraceae bacterium KSS8]
MPPSLKRSVGGWSLLFTGIGSIIGSGWLFGAERAASIAGPAAILAWLIGAAVVLILAIVASELGGMFPVSGGMVRFSHATHGPLVGFLAGFANWIAIVSAIPVEAEASVQYMSSWPYGWAHALYDGSSLTTPGLLIAGVLVVIYMLLNYWSVQIFAKSNLAITLFKLVVPALTGIALFCSEFHAGNVAGTTPGSGGFMPFGAAGVLTAVATSGIVFAYNGFQSPLNLAGEARNPDRSIPFAVVGSVAIAAVIYVLLQVSYLGAINPAQLLSAGGWAHINFSSPFAQLALAFQLNWLAFLLYFDAFLSPSGTGSAYMASTSRMIVGMERNGTAPEAFGRIHPLYGAPRNALWFNLAISFIFLYFFRGWGALAAVVSVATVISYLMIPIAALTLRRTAPALRRPVRTPALGVLGPVAFVVASELLYWARWPLTAEIILLLAAAVPIYGFYRRNAGAAALMAEFRASIWLLCFLPALAFLSWIGSREFGGLGILPYGWDMLIVALVSLGFCFWGVRSGIAEPAVADLIEA